MGSGGMGMGAISGGPLKKTVKDVMPKLDKALRKSKKSHGKDKK